LIAATDAEAIPQPEKRLMSVAVSAIIGATA
jgi:hypothetical protein